MRNELTTDNTIALLVDMQQRLMPSMSHKESVTMRTGFLLRCLSELEVPCILSEQYTRGLGETVTYLKEAGRFEATYEKMTFSCWNNDELRMAMEARDRKNVILFGVEAHICVLQTTLDLQANGYQVYMVCDCTDSRSTYDREIAFRRMESEGIRLTTSESLVYELMKQAGTDVFKRISRLVKEAPLTDF